MRTLLLLFAIIVFVCSAAAQSNIQPDRPDQSETPVVLSKHRLQLETGLLKQNLRAATVHTAPFILLRYGLLKHVELGLEAAHRYHKIENSKEMQRGFAAPMLNTRVAVYKGSVWIPKITLFTGLTVPFLASSAFKPDEATKEIRFAFGNEITEALEVEYNAGIEWEAGMGEAVYVYTFTPSIKFLEKWSAFAEVYGEMRTGLSGKTGVGTGLLFWPSNNVVLDVHGGFGLNNFKTTAYAGLGCSVLLHR